MPRWYRMLHGRAHAFEPRQRNPRAVRRSRGCRRDRPSPVDAVAKELRHDLHAALQRDLRLRGGRRGGSGRGCRLQLACHNANGAMESCAQRPAGGSVCNPRSQQRTMVVDRAVRECWTTELRPTSRQYRHVPGVAALPRSVAPVTAPRHDERGIEHDLSRRGCGGVGRRQADRPVRRRRHADGGPQGANPRAAGRRGPARLPATPRPALRCVQQHRCSARPPR